MLYAQQKRSSSSKNFRIMNNNRVRAILSLIIVSFVMLVTAGIAVYTYANDLQGLVDEGKAFDHIQNYLSLFTGIIGVIIGFYFGKESNPKN